MTRAIELVQVSPPPLQLAEADELPAIGADELEARIAALTAAVRADCIVVYGDREHAANLIYLTNLDPRFEEALLVLCGDRRTLILGKEDVGYVPLVPIDVEVVCCPTFSLMGIDRSGGPTLEDALRDAGLRHGHRVGVVGWKALGLGEWSGAEPAMFAPAFFVDTLRQISGATELVTDATAALTSPRSGLRTCATADQIAVFEWGASRCSAWVHAIMDAAASGVSEREAFRAAAWSGEPLSYHPVFASGPDVAMGLRSPSARRLALGDAAVTAVGLWGGNCARGGLIAASASDLTSASDGYLERLARPYWRAIATWYESLAVGLSGGELYETVTGVLAGQEFASSLNPGHLIHHEEWLDSPIRPPAPTIRSPAGWCCRVTSSRPASGPAGPPTARTRWRSPTRRCAPSSGPAIPSCGRGLQRGRSTFAGLGRGAARRGAAAVGHGRVFAAVLAGAGHGVCILVTVDGRSSSPCEKDRPGS